MRQSAGADPGFEKGGAGGEFLGIFRPIWGNFLKNLAQKRVGPPPLWIWSGALATPPRPLLIWDCGKVRPLLICGIVEKLEIYYYTHRTIFRQIDGLNYVSVIRKIPTSTNYLELGESDNQVGL